MKWKLIPFILMTLALATSVIADEMVHEEMVHEPWEIPIHWTTDIVSIIALISAIWLSFKAIKIGGIIGKGVKYVLTGIFILLFEKLIMLPEHFFGIEMMEKVFGVFHGTVHHIIITSYIVFLLVGLYYFAKAVKMGGGVKIK